MRLLNTKTFPPAGFPYTQPETGQSFNGMVPFNNQVAAIVQHRRANRLTRSNPNEVSQDLHDYTCTRLGNNPDYCADGVVVLKKKQNMLGAVGEAANRAAEVVNGVASGARILTDWLGDGAQPVAQELAQTRSDICTGRINGNPCPKNRQSGWSFTMAVAKAIHSQMAKKDEAGLKVEGESELGTCEACGCFLKLKAWVPFHHIYAHTSDDQMNKFPPWCWVVKEKQQEQQLIPA